MKRIKYAIDGKGSNDGIWLGMQEDNQVVTLDKTFVEQNFSKRFVNECKRLGNNKFVGIPIGSARSSIMAILPSLHCEGAPPLSIHRMTLIAVFSSCWPPPSIAQVFHH